MDLSCYNCHGTPADHAAALLKEEGDKGQAARLLSFIQDKGDLQTEEINPRKPWTMEPDCLTCHVEFEPPETEDAFNTWTDGEDALFHNRLGELGSLQPLQYQDNPYPIAANKNCAVCHTVAMDDPMHHPGSLGNFRNEE